jgi:hypothetical protein
MQSCAMAMVPHWPLSAMRYSAVMTDQRPIPAPVPARVPLSNTPLGIFGSLRAGRENVLLLIPEVATRAPILSGRTVKRWHMVMDPEALRRILRDKVEDYPKSVVTKLILEPRPRCFRTATSRPWHR